MSLLVFKCISDAILPKYATKFSACFDIHACLVQGLTVQSIDENGIKKTIEVSDDRKITLDPKSRTLIPTGLKFNIPPCCSVRLHPRSGLAFKHGLFLINCEGIIDEDYYDQVFVAMHNSSGISVDIVHGDRICQAEMIRDYRQEIVLTDNSPGKKSDRSGGFGSTGK